MNCRDIAPGSIRQASFPWALVLCLSAACQAPIQDGPPDRIIDIASIPEPVPKFERRSRTANPDSYVVLGKRYHVMKDGRGFVQRGIASWYGKKFHGKATASGEIYDMFSMTAAHKTLPIPSYVQVTNLENGRKAVVRINDRGPFHEDRIIDLSYAAAVKLGVSDSGTAPVEIRVIEPERPTRLTTEIFLQIGAFRDLANAQRLSARLNQTNLPKAVIHASHDKGRRLFRVRIGPLETRDQLDTVTRRLRRHGFNPTVVYRN